MIHDTIHVLTTMTETTGNLLVCKGGFECTIEVTLARVLTIRPLLRVFFLWNPNEREEAHPATQTEKKSAKYREQKPLSPSSRNNGSQVHEINKWALRKQMGSKEPRKREIANSKPKGSVWCEKK